MQESKYITINAKSLFEEPTSSNINLEITEEGLRVKRWLLKIHESSDTDSNLDFLNYNFYIKRKTKDILNKEIKSIPTNKYLIKTKFTTLNDPDLAKVIENPEGIAVDKESFCIIGSFEVPHGEKKENLVAFEKNDLEILEKSGKGWALLLVENRPFKSPEEETQDGYPNSNGLDGPRIGVYYSNAVDSGVQQTQWYRFMLEGEFPEGTKVEFDYHISDYTSDKLKANEPILWKNWEEGHISDNCISDEPKAKETIERNSDEPKAKETIEWKKGLSGSSTIQGEERRDALFQTEEKGRYLWFRIILIGTESLSPKISSVTVYFPKVSYLEYLPPVYREDFANNDFLDRFLAIFESIFFEIDFTIDHLSRWLDAAGTPPEFLDWLGSWIGADQGRVESLYRKEFPEAKKREYISRAVSMYKERGTKAGLENLISFYTGKTPIIIENLPFDCTKGNTENVNWNKAQNVINESKLFDGKETGKMKSQHDIFFGRDNFSFLVLFKEKLDEAEKELIRDIIEEVKPAHTTYKLIEPGFYLDGNTYLGINAELPPSVLTFLMFYPQRGTAPRAEDTPYVAKKIV